jgi:hypothetical protein
MAYNSPFVPPADYPMDELMLRPKRPRTPPLDYAWNGPYPFRSYGEGQSFRHSADVVRTTAEATQGQNMTPHLPKPDYPTQHNRYQEPVIINNHKFVANQAAAIARRHTTNEPLSPSMQPIRVRSTSGMNKAFLHHMKNFDRFATIKGRGACCAGCPICKAITAANVALTYDDSPSPEDTPPMAVGRATKLEKIGESSPEQRFAKSYPINSALNEDDDDDAEDYQKERRQRAFLRDLTKRRARVARVNADRVSRHVRELTVTKGEYLEILDDTRRWWACSNVSGQLGYVPSTILGAAAFEEIALTGGGEGNGNGVRSRINEIDGWGKH